MAGMCVCETQIVPSNSTWQVVVCRQGAWAWAAGGDIRQQSNGSIGTAATSTAHKIEGKKFTF